MLPTIIANSFFHPMMMRSIPKMIHVRRKFFLSGCTDEKHLIDHDVDPYAITADKIKMKCICEMKADPVRETRAVYNKVHLELKNV